MKQQCGVVPPEFQGKQTSGLPYIQRISSQHDP